MLHTRLPSPCSPAPRVQPWPWFGGGCPHRDPQVPIPQAVAGSWVRTALLGTGGFWCSDKHCTGAASRMPMGRAALVQGWGGPARAAPAFRVQRVTVAGGLGACQAPADPRCLPASPAPLR